jgi:tetratricopeptide (TPR) repeat protein/serine/threonine protein kinase
MNEEEIFHQALARSPEERAAYLEQACAGDPALRASVEALLRANVGATGFLDQAAPDPVATVDEQPTRDGPGAVIGPYKLLEQIGEGGFGVVFMAEQTQPVRRKVALKILKPGMDTRQVVARFEAERQALAIMEHPNIARVFDGGATPSGRPYFVMELVKGVPITEFCDQNRLTPRQRLELFIPVCQAVQHAHQKGIIHRDLKPSNVLVSRHDTTPVVKVIDFGVAKALGQELTDKTLFTGIAQMIGTPLYMSPEQAGMSDLDVDTRSDIYSLGVLLYELLTGTTPFTKDRFKHAAYDEIRRIIREEDPPKPSTRLSDSKDSLPSISAQRQTEPAKLARIVRGELDWIVMKALEKDRNRRYETANGLAHDIERYLHDEPVQACPPSAWYRWRKFRRRHRHAVVVALALCLGVLATVVVLAISTVLISRERAEAVRQKNQAEENFRMAKEAIDGFYTKVSESDLFDQPGAQPLRKQLLEDARKFYERILQQQQQQQNGGAPNLRAELAATYFRVWQIDVATNRYSDGMVAWRKGLDIAEELYRENPNDLELYKRLAGFRSGGFSFHWWCLVPAGSGVNPIYQKAANFWEPLVQRYPGESDFQLALAEVYGRLANLWRCHDVTPPAKALAMYQKSYNLCQKVARANPTVLQYQVRLASAQVMRGIYLGNVRRFEEGEKSIRQGLDFAERMSLRFPTSRPLKFSIAHAHYRLVDLYMTARRYEEADKAFSQARDYLERWLREFPKSLGHLWMIAACHWERATSLLERGKLQDAEAEARQAIARFEKLVAAFPGEAYEFDCARSHMTLGKVISAAGRSEEGVGAFRDAVAVYEKLDARRFPVEDGLWVQGSSDCYQHLVNALKAKGERRQAAQAARSAIAFYEHLAKKRNHPAVEKEMGHWYVELGKVLVELGRHHEADEVRAKALASWKRVLEDNPASEQDRWVLSQSQRELARVFSADPKLAKEAEDLYRQALAILEKLAADNPTFPNFRQDAGHTERALGWLLRDSGRHAEAAAAFQKALDLFQTLSREYPEEANFLVLVGDTLVNMGMALRGASRPQEAEQAYRQAVVAYAELLARFPKTPDSWWRLPGAQRDLAFFLLQTKRPAEAEAEFRKLLETARQSTAILEKLAADFRHEWYHRHCLAENNHICGAAFRELNRPVEAEQAFRQAIAMFEKLAGDFPGNSDSSAAVGYSSRDLGWLLMSMRRFEEAAQAFKKALDHFQRLVRDHPESSGYLLHVGDTLVQIGHALKAATRPQEAEQAYRQAVVAQSELVAKFPQAPDHRVYLGWAYNALAALLSEQKRPAEAEASYRKCLEVAEKGATEFPGNSNLAELIGRYALHLGWHLMALKQHAEAERLLGQALERFKKLPAPRPEDLRVQAELSNQYLSLAQALVKAAADAGAGKPDEAEKAYRRALAIEDGLAADFPGQPSYRAESGWTCRKLASLLVWLPNRFQGAEKIHARDVSAFEKLAAAFPDNPSWPEQLAHGHRQWGFELWATNRLQEAEKSLREAIKVLETSSVKFGKAAVNHSALLADTYGTLARLLEGKGRRLDALDATRRLVDILEGITPERNSQDLSGGYINLVRLLRATKQDTDAEQVFARARRVFEARQSQFPEQTNHRHELGRIYNHLGLFLASTGRGSEAEKAHRQALDIYQTLARARLPEDQDRWRRQELMWTQENLGYLAKNTGRPKDAENAFRQAVSLGEQLNSDFPGQNYISWMTRNYRNLVMLLAANGRVDEADKAYRRLLELAPQSALDHNALAWMLATSPDAKFRDPRRAVELARKAVELAPKEGGYWNTLGVAHYRAADWKAAIAALAKSMELRRAGDSFDWFFLAMAHWQLGDKKGARKWYDQAVQWMEKNQPKNEELWRFRAEAEKLMEVKK